MHTAPTYLLRHVLDYVFCILLSAEYMSQSLPVCRLDAKSGGKLLAKMYRKLSDDIHGTSPAQLL